MDISFAHFLVSLSVYPEVELITLDCPLKLPGVYKSCHCRGAKIIFCPPGFFGRTNKLSWDRINRIQRNENLMTYVPTVYMGDTQKHWVAHQNVRSHHLNYHHQLKRKAVGGRKSVRGAYHEMHWRTGLRLLCRFRSLPFLFLF